MILSDKDFALKPANTTECTAPILAHANIEIAASGIIGRYIITLSPFLIPNDFKQFANVQTSLKSSSYVNDFWFSLGSFGSHNIEVLFLFLAFLSKIFSVIFNTPSLNHSTLGSSKFQDSVCLGFFIHLKDSE